MKDRVFKLRVTEAQLTAWQQAAEDEQRSVSGWLRWAAAQALKAQAQKE